MTHPVFLLLGEPRPAITVQMLEPEPSPLTDRTLRRAAVQTGSMPSSTHEELETELSGDDGAAAVILDTDGGRWEVATRSFSCGDGGDAVEHRFDLTELEDVTVKQITFRGVTLRPDRSSVELRSGSLCVEVMVDVAPNTDKAVEAALEATRTDEALYFPVSLVGVRENPVPMRFGQCLWRDLGNGKRRHRLVLVGEEGDDTTFRGFNYPETGNLMSEELRVAAKFDQLVIELQAAGALSSDAVDRIQATKPGPRASRVFDRDDDLDYLP